MRVSHTRSPPVGVNKRPVNGPHFLRDQIPGFQTCTHARKRTRVQTYGRTVFRRHWPPPCRFFPERFFVFSPPFGAVPWARPHVQRDVTTSPEFRKLYRVQYNTYTSMLYVQMYIFLVFFGSRGEDTNERASLWKQIQHLVRRITISGVTTRRSIVRPSVGFLTNIFA